MAIQTLVVIVAFGWLASERHDEPSISSITSFVLVASRVPLNSGWLIVCDWPLET